jgi:hypothetical protein
MRSSVVAKVAPAGGFGGVMVIFARIDHGEGEGEAVIGGMPCSVKLLSSSWRMYNSLSEVERVRIGWEGWVKGWRVL